MLHNQIHGGTRDAAFSERELRHAALARKLAAEGMVLLKNEDLLPLDVDQPLALLGTGAVKTVKGGLGSGDVNNRRNISLYEGLVEAGASIVSRSWLSDYADRYNCARESWKAQVLEAAKHVENAFDAYVANPFVRPEGRRLTDADVDGAQVIVYVVSRVSGEGNDRRLQPGDYELSAQEWEDLLFLDQKGLPIVLVINAGGVVDLTDLLEKTSHIGAILVISQPGQEGGYAFADVLFGKTAPGGRLTATWAKKYEDYPFSESFSYLNGDLTKEEYKEGIFVGYRYFDTYGVEPLFPFGYGLTYTDFEIYFEELRMIEGGFEAAFSVKNTGARPGREVVQLYMTPPQGDAAKERYRLIGFTKTNMLAPGEIQRVTIHVSQKQLASYRERVHVWYMDAGNYVLSVGKNSSDLEMCAVLEVAEYTVIEQCTGICPRQHSFEELGACEQKQADCEKQKQAALAEKIQKYPFVPKNETTRFSVCPDIPEQPVEALIPLLYGNLHEAVEEASAEATEEDAGTNGMLGTSGIRVPGSAGETSEALERAYGIRPLAMADGPAGLRLQQSYEVDPGTDLVYGAGVLRMLENGYLDDTPCHEGADTYYQYCTAFPVGTALAQTWDSELLRQFGEAIGEEMQEFHVDLWLAPGMNVQRNPLCGRNFEYYSEDPLVSGMMAAAVTKGVQSCSGCGVTIKHFACNNQEDHRMGVDAQLSERALREIYVRGFEIAVKEAKPLAIMTSYNRVNGVQTANSKDLCTVLAREEWGFDGVIMSDWSTTAPDDGSIPWQCVTAGNDIIMPGSPKDVQSIRNAYREGVLSADEIRACAGRVIDLVRRLDAQA